MPTVEAHLLSGYDPDDKSRLVTALTEAVRFVIPAPDEAITILLHEYPAENYGRGGQMRPPAPARPDPKELVLAYLAAMEARDIEAAQSMLGDGFKMTFPGTAPMTSLAELIDWARDRYTFVQKTYDAVEAFQSGPVAVVYARGGLSGEWPDGAPFSGIRFIDRFEVADGLLIRQDVWNDLAEARGT
ncbi:tautomerase family protein [Jannaschia sp. CCS1]|uniref:tautomerase family protein n=1 Tax=Jannaschia sp. (strain CCS1) TaxID=290400 RepID=UPI000053BFAE|nr:tautomerase family protein [Jannaschia sp. CCS1]ABD56680.1 4-oxalocrotonate tautomerase [Jannaschia sp. CCS1]